MCDPSNPLGVNAPINFWDENKKVHRVNYVLHLSIRFFKCLKLSLISISEQTSSQIQLRPWANELYFNSKLSTASFLDDAVERWKLAIRGCRTLADFLL